MESKRERYGTVVQAHRGYKRNKSYKFVEG